MDSSHQMGNQSYLLGCLNVPYYNEFNCLKVLRHQELLLNK